MADLVALADDLTGAVEIAPLIALRESRTIVHLYATDRAIDSATGTQRLVLDLDLRQKSAPAIAGLLDQVLADPTVGVASILFAKIDSLLRGPIEAIVGGLHRHRAAVVLAPALPQLQRSVRGGTVHLADEPLHLSDAWSAESRPAPRSIAEALPSIPTQTLSLSRVRSPALAESLLAALEAGFVPVCDAETELDLEAIARAASTLAQPCLVGAGGLAAALGRITRPRDNAPAPDVIAEPVSDRNVALLVVIGTAERAARTQAGALSAAGWAGLEVSVAELSRPPSDARLHAFAAALRAGGLVLTVTPRDGAAFETAADLSVARGLADLVARVDERTQHPIDLVLIGGETARRVLDRLGVTRLTAHEQIQHGAVRCTTPDGRVVVTRPGRFGDPDSLLSIVSALRPGVAAQPCSLQPQ